MRLKKAIENTLTGTLIDRGRFTPSLFMDFVNQKYQVQKNVFSRASTASYWAYDGVLRTAEIDRPRFEYDPVTGGELGPLVEESRTNFMTYSEDFSQATTIARMTVSPGSSTYFGKSFTKLIPTAESGTHLIRRSNSGSGVSQMTIYAKAAGYRYLLLSRSGASYNAAFDLVDGVVIHTPSLILGDATSSDLGASIEHVGNGVYRCSYSQGRASIIDLVINEASFAAAGAFVGDGTSGIEVFGWQDETGDYPTSYIPTVASTVTRSADVGNPPPYSNFEEKTFEDLVTLTRASTATYWDSTGTLQTAAMDSPRFEYNPLTLELEGLFLEESRTNLFTHSEDFSDVSWGLAGATTSSPTEPDPSGGSGGIKLTEDNTDSIHRISNTYSSALTGESYTFSCFIKPAEHSFIILRFGGTGAFGTDTTATFNLSNGTVSYVGTALSRTSIQETASGWFRLSITATAIADGPVYSRIFLTNDGINDSYQGDGVSGVYIWGAQLEQDSYITSYIPTTGSVATRSADVATVDDINPWFSDKAEMTLYGEWIPLSATVNTSVVWHSIRDNTSNIGNGYFGFYNSMNSLIYSGIGGESATVEFFAYPLSSIAKTALTVSKDTATACVDGVSKACDPRTFGSFTYNTGLLELTRGDCNGYLRAINFHPVSMTSTELEQLTT